MVILEGRLQWRSSGEAVMNVTQEAKEKGKCNLLMNKSNEKATPNITFQNMDVVKCIMCVYFYFSKDLEKIG